MLIAHRNGMAVLGKPYDAEVEYLESTGTQLIDTGFAFVADVGSGIECIFERIGQASYRGVPWGSQTIADSNWGFNPWWNSNTVCNFYVGSSGALLSISAEVNSTVDVRLDVTSGGKVVMTAWGTETLKTYSGTIVNGATIGLFGSRNPNGFISGRNFIGRIYCFKVWSGGALVRDFIPVRVGSGASAVGCMYDRVSGQLFRNQGTGNFIVGRDINPISARSYVNDGLVAMWDGIENAGWGVHDASATTWKDLVGNNNLDIYGGIEANCIRTTSTTAAGMSGTISGIATIECCCKINSTGGYLGLLAYSGIMDTTHLGLVRYGPDVGFQTYSDAFWDYSGIATEAARTVTATTSACYVDGVGLQSASHSADQWNNQSYTGIGGRHWQNHNYRAVGDYYCVRFYNRALAATEISANYAIDKARFNLP